MDKLRSSRLVHRILLGSLLFGMFFGAGNLIFPVSIGQHAGNSMNLASLGFIITGVGLASLAAIYCAKSEKLTLESMLSVYGKGYARFFTILLLLTIGPMFALPRTATVPYEVGIRTLFPTINHTYGLLIYSALFFMASLLMALKPNKIKELIGKYINPIFLVCLIFFFAVFFINDMGSVKEITPHPNYVNNTFLEGFKLGYQTMDLLAALAFSFVVISTNKFDEENSTKKEKINDVIFAGVFAGVLMSIIYYILIRIGASSRHLFDIEANGGIALGQIFNHYFGRRGTLFLSLTITVACLKTSTGLIVACSQYFETIIPKVSYKQLVIVFSALGFIVSNIGLDAIIVYAVPILNFLYPLAMMHVFMGIIYDGRSKIVNYSTLVATLVAASIEFIKSFPNFVSKFPLLRETVELYSKNLPFANVGMQWIMFSIVGLSLGILAHMSYYEFKKK